ncbi:MAG TPA: N-6 DNA methylase [Candidatus Dormibacteraeota bacterium]|nr:N-6 DNA methylase [Candidatus Dormibacteraeota bacterium]
MSRLAPKAVTDLIERFERNSRAYLSTAYNETQVRREFIDPLFHAMGWDVSNEQGYAEAYKDVVHEDSITVEGAAKAPDYSFRIGGTRKFFVEAKRPATLLKTDAPAAYQLRRYAWSAKLPLSILTNFREFAVYDCRQVPAASDSASLARITYIPWQELAERWNDIISVFSPDAIRLGAFDEYAESTRRKRGTAAVDDAFLQEIGAWREALARNIALRNAGLSQRELNFAVQRTVDRIVFLRICEDRGLEDYGRLRELERVPGIYKQLCNLFRQADDRYNSGLFHFKKEHDHHEAPDSLTLTLTIDDKVLRTIIQRLYYPDSPYEFGVLPADILGQVYEQFLGKVIRLTAGHRAVVEDKPEIARAGGVYYTPTYVVEYIVGQALDPLLAGKTPRQVSRMRVLDPACGSGSFLIVAYQHLLDWHLSHYLSDGPEKRTKELFRGQRGEYLLATAERKRILRNNICGVDVDPQAVEVTKLSLLLKVLEGETSETISKQLRLFHERALPDLGDNIKCGNSLVSPGFQAAATQLSLLSEEDEYRINAFSWEDEFPEVCPSPGFDVVIGNPPYVYRNATEELLTGYYRSEYQVAEGNYDLYKFFIERCLQLLRRGGRLGYITSATFLIQPSFEKLRRLCLVDSSVIQLAPLGPGVFKRATVDTTILVLSPDAPSADHEVEVVAPIRPDDLASTPPYRIPQRRFARNPGCAIDYRLSEEGARLVARLVTGFPSIESGYEFGVGINTGFIRDELTAGTRVDARYHPMIPGSGISRYGPVRTSKWILYDAAYVRARGSLGRTLPAERLLNSDKILVVRTRNLSLKRRIVATIDRTRAYNLNRLSNIIARDGYRLEGLLGILNSSLFNWLFSTRFFDYEVKPVYLRVAPLADSNDVELGARVSRIMDLRRRLEVVRTGHEAEAVARQLKNTDREIDAIVCRLYGLTTRETLMINESPYGGALEDVGDPAS